MLRENVHSCISLYKYIFGKPDNDRFHYSPVTCAFLWKTPKNTTFVLLKVLRQLGWRPYRVPGIGLRHCVKECWTVTASTPHWILICCSFCFIYFKSKSCDCTQAWIHQRARDKGLHHIEGWEPEGRNSNAAMCPFTMVDWTNYNKLTHGSNASYNFLVVNPRMYRITAIAMSHSMAIRMDKVWGVKVGPVFKSRGKMSATFIKFSLILVPKFKIKFSL